MKLSNSLKYLNVSHYWKILNPIYESNKIKKLALYEMNCYRENACKVNNLTFNAAQSFQYPKRFDSCDWRFSRKGRPPIFDNWICHAACHWIANINAAVVMEAFPDREWRVINSDYYSTVWDGESTIDRERGRGFLAISNRGVGDFVYGSLIPERLIAIAIEVQIKRKNHLDRKTIDADKSFLSLMNMGWEC